MSLESSVEWDLELSGDEAQIFMEGFFDHFGIERGDYEFDRYFGGEGFNLFAIFFAMLSPSYKKRHFEREPITIRMLQRAIELGTWDSARIG
ncbi:hypothetical protein NK8_59090 (plasmid) [Caballeronia sp. NK8]|nr:hypothetical protein NK8_59090 [Caballeronia sp. NK8]